MQNDVAATRRGGDRGMIAGIDLDRLGAGGDVRGRARPHQARHPPAGIAKGFRRGVAEPAGGA